MAIIFELYAECLQKEKADKLATHFDSLDFHLHNGRIIKWKVARQNPGPQIYAVVVYSLDLSRSGVRSVQDAVESTECGLRLYHHLKSCPVFEFARVGWEVEMVTMLDLKEYIEPMGDTGELYCHLQCVISCNLYEQLERPKFFREFLPGYVWNTYCGEKYHPLLSSDQEELNETYRELFPEMFSHKQ